MNLAENAPDASVVAPATIPVVPKNMLTLELAVKPEPVIAIMLPGEPETGEREIEGAGGGGGEPVTVKVALAEIPIESVAAIVYVPAATGGTGKVVEKEPVIDAVVAVNTKAPLP